MEKTHEFIIKVKFDKPCSKSVALYHMKDEFSKTIHDLNTFGWDKTCPSVMAIFTIKPKINENK